MAILLAARLQDPGADPALLTRHATNRNGKVREAVAANPSTPQEARLRMVALTTYMPDRYRANCILKLLAQNPSSRRADLEAIAKLKPFPETLYYVARNIHCGQRLLAQLAALGNEVTVAALANPAAKDHLLSQYVNFPSRRVRHSIAEHPNASLRTKTAAGLAANMNEHVSYEELAELTDAVLAPNT